MIGTRCAEGAHTNVVVVPSGLADHRLTSGCPARHAGSAPRGPQPGMARPGRSGVALRAHLRRERNPKLRRRKLDDTNVAVFRSPARRAASTSARPTAHMAWTTSNAIIALHFT